MDTITINRTALRDAILAERLAADRLRRASLDINSDYAGYVEAQDHYEKCAKALDRLIYTPNEAP